MRCDRFARDEVVAIYQAGVDEGNATFETVWVAATRVSDRCAYAGVVEHSVYVHPDARGRGVASALLKALVDSTEAAGIWTVQSGIFPENAASLAVHARAGFRVVGTRERVGRHHGIWRDTVLVERRSPHID
ncbi:N-acetyltransferase family protein [Streptomyces sp. NPDC051180]|uniref:GNAT family N-acetyltransferase n=1 Tax=unclassified Streptomyces TaxID=2593676 RepID=UPI00344D5329